MDAIDLPLADLSTPLTEAFAAMKSAGCSAIVARAPSMSDHLFLFRAEDVVEQMAKSAGVLDDVSARWKLAPPPAPGSPQGVALWKGPLAMGPLAQDFDLFFGSTGSPYIVASVGPVSVRILTRTEGHAGPFRAVPSDCYCSGPLQHRCSRPPDQPCNQIGCHGVVTCV